jgi:hypothetical protein
MKFNRLLGTARMFLNDAGGEFVGRTGRVRVSEYAIYLRSLWAAPCLPDPPAATELFHIMRILSLAHIAAHLYI